MSSFESSRGKNFVLKVFYEVLYDKNSRELLVFMPAHGLEKVICRDGPFSIFRLSLNFFSPPLQ
jgi:hypothetical protein